MSHTSTAEAVMIDHLRFTGKLEKYWLAKDFHVPSFPYYFFLKPTEHDLKMFGLKGQSVRLHPEVATKNQNITRLL